MRAARRGAGLHALVRLTVLLAALSILAPSLPADWLQAGSDPQRTRSTSTDGPAVPDIALSTKLPSAKRAGPTAPVPPLVVGDNLYTLQWTRDSGTVEGTTQELYSTSLSTSQATALWEFESQQPWGRSMGSDGERIFVAMNHELHAYDLAAATVTWTASIDPVSVDPGEPMGPGRFANEQACPAMTIHEAQVILACASSPGLFSATLFVVAFDAVTGTRLGTPIMRDMGFDDEPEIGPGATTPITITNEHRPDSNLNLAIPGIATDGRYAAVTIDMTPCVNCLGGTTTDVQYARVWVVDLATPEGPTRASAGNVWMRQYDTTPQGVGAVSYNLISPPLIVGDRVFVKHRFAESFNLADGSERRTWNDYRDGVVLDGDQGAGFAVDASRIYAGFSDRMVAVTRDGSLNWAFDLPPGQRWAGSPVITPNALFGMSRGDDGLETLWNLEPASGTRQWPLHPLPLPGNGAIAVAEDRLAIAGPDGIVQVLARLPFSLDLTGHPTGTYPAVGEAVTVRLQSTGGLAPALTYMADWGDGTVTPWQESPAFTHEYGAAVDRVAIFTARNGANQTSTARVPLLVGQKDPAKNIFNAPLSPEYQNTTFFLLGILGSLLIALLGVHNAGRKRRRLARELRDLEAVYRENEADPFGCEAILAERRAHARTLFLKRKLEEAHASFLMARVDELRQSLRMAEVEQRLDFLPFGMVKGMREMLRDSRVTDWERSQFLTALERDASLSRDQKESVRRLIEGWFAQDSTEGR